MAPADRKKAFRVALDNTTNNTAGDDEGGTAGLSCSVVGWLYQRIFVDLREEDDSFEMILRKIVVSVGLILAVFPVSFAVYLAAEVSQVGVTPGNLSTLIVMLLFPLVWVPTYLVVRTSKYLPDALLDVWLIGTTAGIGILAASFVEYPISQLALFLAIMALLCSTPRLPLHLGACFLVYSVAMLNTAFSGLDRNPDVMLLTMPEPYRGTVLERVAYQVTGLTIGIVVLSALVLQTRERRRHEAAAISAIDMARTVAEQLSIYDVVAVKRTLDAVQEENVVDPELIEHLSTLADNLEGYRPHLPNWMLNDFHQHEMGNGDDDGNGDQSDTEGEWSVTLDATNGSTDLGTKTSSSEGHHAFSRSPATTTRTVHSTAVLRGTAVTRSPHGKSPLPGHLTVGTSQGTHRTYFAGRVTMACVTFVVAKKIKVARREELMAAFVDRVHAIAAQTNAAVHSFLGDQVYVSWNSTTKVFQPEAKASKFLIRTSEIAQDEPLLTLSGAAFTGDARCILAGHKHSAFTISFRWRETLRALTTYCHRHGAFAVDPSTRTATQFDIVTRGIDALLVNDWKTKAGDASSHHQVNAFGSHSSFGSSRATRVVNIYELVREIAESENDDEWMYVLRRNAAAEGGDKVLNMCLTGDYVGAMERLEEEMDLVRATSSAQMGNSNNTTSNGSGLPHAGSGDGAALASARAGGMTNHHSASGGVSDLESTGDDAIAKSPAKRRSDEDVFSGGRRSTLTPRARVSRSRGAGMTRAAAGVGRATSVSEGSLSDVGGGARDSDTASSVDPYCAPSFHKDAASTAAVHGMRLLQNLYYKVCRFHRERLPANRFPEDFTSANWKQ